MNNTFHIATMLNEDNIKQLQEGNVTNIFIIKTGIWDSDWHGDFEFKKEDLEQMVKNFNNNVYRQEVPINFGHDRGGKAAGWHKVLSVEDIDDNNSHLRGDIDLTPAGAEAVKNGEYKYYSAEIAHVYKDEDTGGKFANVLIGGALTNIPFMKGQDAIKLSEGVYCYPGTGNQDIDTDINEKNKEDLKMSKLNKIFKLEEGAAEAAVEEAAEAVVAENDGLKVEAAQVEDAVDSVVGEEDKEKTLSEKIAILAERGKKIDKEAELKLSEKDKEIMALSSKLDEQGKEIKELQSERYAEKVAKMYADNSDRVTDVIKARCDKLFTEGATIETVTEVLSGYPVIKELGEVGTSRGGETGGQKGEMLTLQEKYMAEGKTGQEALALARAEMKRKK